MASRLEDLRQAHRALCSSFVSEELFRRFGIRTTWFIPGHSIETFPAEMKAVADAGHEIGIHGYSHENPIAMTPAQEEAVLDRCIDLVTKLSGRRPTGYVVVLEKTTMAQSLDFLDAGASGHVGSLVSWKGTPDIWGRLPRWVGERGGGSAIWAARSTVPRSCAFAQDDGII